MALFIKRALVSALGVFIGSSLLPGIYYDDSTSLFLAVLLLGIFSAVLRPILVLLTLPFVVLTMGIGLLMINALLYAFVGYLVNGFYVDGFGYAFLGSFIITLLNLFFNKWINGGAKRSKTRIRVEKRGSVDVGIDQRVSKQTLSERRAIHHNDDVIDI
ncbi:MAG: phage holin family protein [Opitutales bacterium]|nr:phage holin family protein [Opitutales bacterium]|tara:strand:- start:168 stop:644 length:477 start_codon:yes stop_codon:yes gene_type:complete